MDQPLAKITNLPKKTDVHRPNILERATCNSELILELCMNLKDKTPRGTTIFCRNFDPLILNNNVYLKKFCEGLNNCYVEITMPTIELLIKALNELPTYCKPLGIKASLENLYEFKGEIRSSSCIYKWYSKSEHTLEERRSLTLINQVEYWHIEP